MLISGLTAYYSFKKRRSNLLSQLQQRSVKLLVGYCVGIILVIVPSRFFLQVCFSMSQSEEMFSANRCGQATDSQCSSVASR